MNGKKRVETVVRSLLVVVLGLSGCGGGPVAAPTSYTDYVSGAGTYQCELPADWEVEGTMGTRGAEWTRCSKGIAQIHVNADEQGSMMADQLKVGQSGEDYVPPVESLHEMGAETIMRELTNYSEVAEPIKLNVSLGQARASEFTADGSYGAKMHGYRATMLGRNKRVVVICKCSEDDWTTLKPAFEQVLASFKRGKKKS